MPASLTEKEFSQHIGTKFHLKADQSEIELELMEVKGYVSQQIEQDGMERFSVFFVGPADPYLPQRLYRLEHEHIGEFEIFLVPMESTLNQDVNSIFRLHGSGTVDVTLMGGQGRAASWHRARSGTRVFFVAVSGSDSCLTAPR